MGIEYFAGFYLGMMYMVAVYAIFPFVKVGIERPYRAILKLAIMRRLEKDVDEEAQAKRMLGDLGGSFLRGVRKHGQSN